MKRKLSAVLLVIAALAFWVQSTSAQTPPSGQPMPTATPDGWRPILLEDFNNPAAEGQFVSVYGNRFNHYPRPWKDTSGRGNYSADFISATGGVLTQRLHSNAQGPQVSAIVPRIDLATRDDHNLGLRISERLRVPVVADGFKMAHLMWPLPPDNYPEGEMDWPEMQFSNEQPYAYLFPKFHDPHGGITWPGSTGKAPLDMSQWHTYVTEWVPGTYWQVSVDGTVLRTWAESCAGYPQCVRAEIPDVEFRYVHQNETEVNDVPIDPRVTARIEVDWMTVHVPSGTPPPPTTTTTVALPTTTTTTTIAPTTTTVAPTTTTTTPKHRCRGWGRWCWLTRQRADSPTQIGESTLVT